MQKLFLRTRGRYDRAGRTELPRLVLIRCLSLNPSLNPESPPRLCTTVSALTSLCAVAVAALGGCGGGGGGGDGGGDGGGGGGGGGTSVTVSGKAQYESPPPGPNCNGLDFNDIRLKPIRQATVQLRDATTDAVLDETVTDDDGNFELGGAADTSVYLRVRAELKRNGSPSWDVEVRDNVTSAAVPVALEQRPLYVLDGSAFDSGDAAQTRDLTATTGWDGTAYTSPRAAAPFAVLDSVYNGMLLVLTREPQLAFEPLDVFWSVNNTATVGEPQDIDAGELGTSFYRTDNKLFLLGMADVDTEEFDDHVIVHEWGHYFEDTLSRSDSIGGAHAIGDRLDMRVAFGEGFATAFSGMALGSAQYCDTLGPSQAGGFGIDIEGQAAGTPGWYNEISIMKLIYDLWDIDVDGADTDSLGFGPIYTALTGAQATTPAFTSIFSFAEALKAENPVHEPFIDALLQSEDIVASGINAYGDGEMNNAQVGAPDVLPVYERVFPDTDGINICSNRQFDPNVEGNKLSEHRFLRMEIGTEARYTFSVVTEPGITGPDDPDDERDQSDPDILIFRNGAVQNQIVDGDLQGLSGDANEEIFTTPDALPVGDYVMALVEFRYQDEESPEDFPERVCFDVTVTQAP